ncbi:MAG: hypothetical protein NT166_05910 [Candidatus Aminicenantes bacterium]|nr:hypothetical protein [Candidatus Aminicenantes bacterium]
MNRSISPIFPGNERAEAYPNENDYTAHGSYFSPVTTSAYTTNSFGQIQSVTLTYTDTYYIYSFDGKPLPEYDQTGSCVRDYIYAGNRLLAKYLAIKEKENEQTNRYNSSNVADFLDAL